jgi:thioredoxin reductase (NADPH)
MDTYDVIIIGGGAAGLSAAITLSRARRRVLVVDAGEPRNEPAAGVHGYLGREGIEPVELLRIGRAELESYGGQVLRCMATGARRTVDGFAVTTDDGGEVAGRRLLVTSGLVDELPDVPGLREQWGRGVIHCPYCHGWEVRDQAVAVLATGPLAGHQALLFGQWTSDVTLLTNGNAEPPDADRLRRNGVRFVAGKAVAVETRSGRVSGVRLADGSVVECAAVVVAPRFVARSAVLRDLGIEPVDQVVEGRLVSSAIPADATGRTSAAGVWVAGNVTDVQASVIGAAAAGANAARHINAELVEQDAR